MIVKLAAQCPYELEFAQQVTEEMPKSSSFSILFTKYYLLFSPPKNYSLSNCVTFVFAYQILFFFQEKYK